MFEVIPQEAEAAAVPSAQTPPSPPRADQALFPGGSGVGMILSTPYYSQLSLRQLRLGAAYVREMPPGLANPCSTETCFCPGGTAGELEFLRAFDLRGSVGRFRRSAGSFLRKVNLLFLTMWCYLPPGALALFREENFLESAECTGLLLWGQGNGAMKMWVRQDVELIIQFSPESP